LASWGFYGWSIDAGAGFLSRVGLVGSSRGGAAVHNAGLRDGDGGHRFGIRAVVGLGADGTTVTELTEALRQRWDRRLPFLNLVGSMDHVAVGNRVLDLHYQLPRPKVLHWVHRAYHNPWNRRWAESDDGLWSGSVQPVGALSDAAHERIGKNLVLAFMMAHVVGWRTYAGFVEGYTWPMELAGFVLQADVSHAFGAEDRPGYLERGPVVVENYRDRDWQLFPGFKGAVPPDADPAKQINALGQAVTYRGVVPETGRFASPGLGSDPAGGDREPFVHVNWASAAGSAIGEPLRPPDEPSHRWAFDPRSLVGLRASVPVRPEHLPSGIDGATWIRIVESETPGPPLDGTLVLSDGALNSHVRVGALRAFTYPNILDAWTNGVAALGDLASQRLVPTSIPETIHLPVQAFLAVQPGLRLTELQRIELQRLSPVADGGVHLFEWELSNALRA
jgi:hypothetical protein